MGESKKEVFLKSLKIVLITKKTIKASKWYSLDKKRWIRLSATRPSNRKIPPNCGIFVLVN